MKAFGHLSPDWRLPDGRLNHLLGDSLTQMQPEARRRPATHDGRQHSLTYGRVLKHQRLACAQSSIALAELPKY